MPARMINNRPSSTTAFNKLPIELNQMIVRCLDTDGDILRYRRICQATYSATDGDGFSFWRTRFREKYALKDGIPGKKLKSEYFRRGKWLRRGVSCKWYDGKDKQEQHVLTILRDLIIETFKGRVVYDDYGHPQCPNQKKLLAFILDSKIFLNDKRKPEGHSVHPFLAAVKLMCAHFLFQLEGATHNVYAVDESQQAVYAATSDAPIFIGPRLEDINMVWVLHCMDFFRHHMMNKEAATLFATMEQLPASEKPSPWREQLSRGSYSLGRHWKGTYAFLDHGDLNKIRKLSRGIAHNGDCIFQDGNVDEGKIQSLELEFLEGADEVIWPQLFESCLQSLRNTASRRSRAQERKGAAASEKNKNIQFIGTGEDLDDNFNAVGWLNPLPEQQGIAGWQRITFMKHFFEDLENLDQDNLWAYEGVVLPGGRIILGRWWYASDPVDLDNDYNGPFIFWAVDDPEITEDDDDDDDDEK